jgi:hypothetical protein
MWSRDALCWNQNHENKTKYAVVQLLWRMENWLILFMQPMDGFFLFSEIICIINERCLVEEFLRSTNMLVYFWLGLIEVHSLNKNKQSPVRENSSVLALILVEIFQQAVEKAARKNQIDFLVIVRFFI